MTEESDCKRIYNVCRALQEIGRKIEAMGGQILPGTTIGSNDFGWDDISGIRIIFSEQKLREYLAQQDEQCPDISEDACPSCRHLSGPRALVSGQG